ncbi:hypothetical protein MUB18_14410 [Sphingobacterium sp. PCS056]|uniref:hypothetical protein n=1 Tax=Sphingobacterium sp. PCS056 TaxID=2931400 RepID=UPI00200EB349|nr:hypothetical protein [Sphingobacterium sp. PCS056]UPZ35299.1 hypothetical protein MUB18_14410 [Sphingobacterium sp. PCS056]
MFEKLEIKRSFYNHFSNEMDKNGALPLFYEILSYGNAYVVGGFFRDFLLNKKSRDIDVIVDIDNDLLLEILKNNALQYAVNRHGGIKVIFKHYTLDIWTISNNWAFKNNLVKLNNEDKLNSIAKGCFYNYDALVINIMDYSYNLRFFKDFFQNKTLNILQEKSLYKNLNPSVEANILRSIYLKKEFQISMSNNTFYYLLKKIGQLSDKYDSVQDHLRLVKKSYPKYNLVTDLDITQFIHYLKYDVNPNNQLSLDL